jgi:DNA-binding CsgD family transcriptional regulator
MLNQSCYRLEQLTRLGLSGQVFIPAFLHELHHYIPSISNTFCWQKTDDSISNIYDEKSNNQVVKHFLRAMRSVRPDKYFHATNWVSSLGKPVSPVMFYGGCPYVAEFYKSVLLPLGYVNSCFVPIIQAKTKIRLGVLIVHRKQGESYFTEKERNYLEYIAGIIAYGLTQPVSKHKYTADGRQQGLLITDHSGKIQHSCPISEKLLVLASVSKFDAYSTHKIHDLNIFKDLDGLITQLKSSSSSKTTSHNPILTINSGWGRFILHGFLIKDNVGLPSQQLGFSIYWQEPFVLKLFHRIKILNLTPRQETVGLLYAKSDSQQDIANKLDLSIHTVKEHVKNLSGRLQIHSRGDLIERILCD